MQQPQQQELMRRRLVCGRAASCRAKPLGQVGGKLAAQHCYCRMVLPRKSHCHHIIPHVSATGSTPSSSLSRIQKAGREQINVHIWMNRIQMFTAPLHHEPPITRDSLVRPSKPSARSASRRWGVVKATRRVTTRGRGIGSRGSHRARTHSMCCAWSGGYPSARPRTSNPPARIAGWW
jgi:hypothetical protein